MKKILSNLMLVAAAAMAFSACQKTEMVEPETSQEVMLTFASEKPAFDDETKTEWTGETIQWSAGDKISVAYTVNGNWQNASGDASGDAKLYKSDALEAATETAKFNVSASFEGTTEGTHVFYGVYPAPSSTSFADAPVATLTVPSIQTPGAASFDGSADLMTGVSVGEFTSLPTEPISMKWTRLVAHANITLKALNGVTAGETVSSITLTAQEGANLVGSQKVDITANTVVNNNNESNVLELNGGNLSIDASGNIEFWACVLPETLTSLAVVVETNKATYTREITGISKTFKQNARNTLSIKMNEATRVAKEEESWVLVTPADGLTEGTYVLVVSTDTKTGALVSTNGTSAAPKFNTSISVSDNTLNGVTEAMQFDLSGTTGNYKLAVTGQTTDYLYTTNGNNGVRVGTNTNNVWTITQHESNADAFVFKCNATSRYLGVYNNADWRCYTAYDADNFTNGSGSSQIYLYKKQSGPEVPDTTPSITVDETLELTSAESEGTISVTYKNLEALDAAAYSDADCTVDCDWLVAAWENDAVSYIAEANEGEERTAYIQIYALDAEANEYTKVITVTQAAKAAEGAAYYEKVTSAPADWSGTYLIVYETGNVAFNGSLTTLDVANNTVPVTISNNTIAYAEELAGSTFVIAKNGTSYSIKSASGSYIGNDSYANALKQSATAYSHTISMSGTDVVLTESNNTTLRFNAASNQMRFRYYKTGQQAIQLYKLVGGEDPVPPVEKTLESIAVSGAKTEYTVGDEFVEPTVTATYSDGSTEDVTASAEFTGYNMSAADTYTVTVSYSGKTTTYSITVSPAQGGGDEGGETTGGTHYVKVTSAPADWSGTYLIVYENSSNAYIYTGVDAANNYVSATISDNAIARSTDIDAVAVTIAQSGTGYSIKITNGTNSGKYISGGSSNGTTFGTTAVANTITLNSNGTVKINNNSTTSLQFNSTSNQMRFRYFTSSQKAVCLYKLN